MKPTRVLALDCSFKTGWAKGIDGEIESGIVVFKNAKAPALRFTEFFAWVNGVLGQGQLDLVTYEQAHFRGRAATEAICGMTTRAEEGAALRRIACLGVRSDEIKKFATGKGNATKEMMMAAAADRFSHYNPENDPGSDEADALWLLAWSLENVEL